LDTLYYQKIDEENERVAEYVKLTDDGEQPPTVDWEALKAMNSDVVGWLQVPGTVVNYPVFQSGDNDYYLSHAPDKSESIGGSVFLDAENTKPGMVDTQSIVYGHHMRNGSQFKQIADMENQELFDGVKTVWYVTESQPYELAPLFVYYTNEEDTDVRQFSFDKDADFRAYLKKYLGEARAKRSDIDQVLGSVRHIFTLSTCNYYDGLGRTLLVCAPKSEIPGTPEYQAAKEAEAKAAEAKKAEGQQEPQQGQDESAQDGAQQQEGQQAEGQQQEQPQSDETEAEAGVEG
jgi:sortase B